jgi:hypothetical protein
MSRGRLPTTPLHPRQRLIFVCRPLIETLPSTSEGSGNPPHSHAANVCSEACCYDYPSLSWKMPSYQCAAFEAHMYIATRQPCLKNFLKHFLKLNVSQNWTFGPSVIMTKPLTSTQGTNALPAICAVLVSCHIQTLS